jgi:hypothetical protein
MTLPLWNFAISPLDLGSIPLRVTTGKFVEFVKIALVVLDPQWASIKNAPGYSEEPPDIVNLNRAVVIWLSLALSGKFGHGPDLDAIPRWRNLGVSVFKLGDQRFGPRFYLSVNKAIIQINSGQAITRGEHKTDAVELLWMPVICIASRFIRRPCRGVRAARWSAIRLKWYFGFLAVALHKTPADPLGTLG